jgi:phage terminase small subunit
VIGGDRGLILKDKLCFGGYFIMTKEIQKKALTRGPNRKLTRRQQKFVRELVSGDGLVTQRESAIRAGFAPSSAHQRAYEMVRMPHIATEIERYREELDALYAVTYKRSERDLKAIRDASLSAGAYSASVQAEVARGKLAGLYTSKTELRVGSIDQMSREDVERELEKIRKSYEPVDITPHEVAEPDAEDSPEEQGVGVLESDLTRVEYNEEKN